LFSIYSQNLNCYFIIVVSKNLELFPNVHSISNVRRQAV
jgi:hypothetical protein